MTLKKIFYPAIFTLASTVGLAQSTVNRVKLKEEFITDSLGCNGKRLSYLDTTATYTDNETKQVKRKILIAGINLEDQKEATVIETLGKPNDTFVRFHTNPDIEEVILWYYITNCGKNKPGLTLVVQILNGFIDSMVIQTK